MCVKVSDLEHLKFDEEMAFWWYQLSTKPNQISFRDYSKEVGVCWASLRAKCSGQAWMELLSYFIKLLGQSWLIIVFFTCAAIIKECKLLQINACLYLEYHPQKHMVYTLNFSVGDMKKM